MIKVPKGFHRYFEVLQKEIKEKPRDEFIGIIDTRIYSSGRIRERNKAILEERIAQAQTGELPNYRKGRRYYYLNRDRLAKNMHLRYKKNC